MKTRLLLFLKDWKSYFLLALSFLLIRNVLTLEQPLKISTSLTVMCVVFAGLKWSFPKYSYSLSLAWLLAILASIYFFSYLPLTRHGWPHQVI